MNRVFVTGASGFLGKNIIEQLSSKYEIVAYSRHPVNSENCTWFEGDILDYNKLRKAMNGCKIVIHLAAITSYNEINADPVTSINNYIIGTMNVLNAMNIVKADTFIYPSSGKVYGFKNKLPYVETDMPLPSNLMGKMKLEVERIIELYSSIMNDCKFIILRIFNAYGKGQDDKFLIPKIINNLNKPYIKLGNIEVKRDYIHIDDIIAAINIVIEKASCGYEIYNLGSGITISVKEIIEIIQRIDGKDINVLFDESQVRVDERIAEYPNISKILTLGWQPQKSINDGLKDIITNPIE